MTKEIRYARTYSSRHHCEVRVEHVVKGRGKGRYEAVVEGETSCWWPDSVVEVIPRKTNMNRLLTLPGYKRWRKKPSP